MGAEHTFHDYVDDTGENSIHQWLNTIPKEVKEKFNNRLMYLEAIGQGQWGRPYYDTLTVGACNGLFELRASFGRQQYRILGYHVPNRKEPTLLWPFIKRGSVGPQADCDGAQTRRLTVESNLRKYRVEHDYG